MTKDKREIVVREQGTTVPFQCPGLSETNYTTWSIMIETVLRAYGHWDAITEDEVDEKKNYTTKGIIFQTLPENVLLQVSKHKNAKDVWESIKVRYIGAERVQKARLQILRNELEMLKMNDTESINDFAGKISGIVAKFKSLGSTLEEEVIQMGKGREQDQLMLASDQTYGESSGRGRGRGRNFERGGRGRGRGRGRGDKSGIRCYDCGEFGHFSYECTKWNKKDNEANLIQDEEPALL
ncbi:zinc finger, CCHC-type containing protein [Tanacetum coccineum]